MAGEYKTDAQTNLNWVQSWSMTVGAPAIAKRIFDTKAHALLFINGDSQNNIDADPSAIAGLVLRVVLDTAENNGIYSVVYVNPSQPSQGLALMRMIDEQRKVTVSSGTTSLAIEANTLYQFASTYKPTALTISSIPDSNLEAEIMFEADGTSGCTITMGSGIEYIGNLNIPAGAKAYINIMFAAVASANNTSGFQLSIDGENITDAIAVPQASSGEENYDDYNKVSANVKLPAGEHILRFTVTGDWMDIDYINFVAGKDAEDTDPLEGTTAIKTVAQFNSFGSYTYRVFDLKGKQVGTVNLDGAHVGDALRAAGFSKGMYMLRSLRGEKKFMARVAE